MPGLIIFKRLKFLLVYGLYSGILSGCVGLEMQVPILNLRDEIYRVDLCGFNLQNNTQRIALGITHGAYFPVPPVLVAENIQTYPQYLPTTSAACRFAWIPAEDTLISLDHQGLLEGWQLNGPKRIFQFEGLPSKSQWLSLHPKGNWLALVDEDNLLHIIQWPEKLNEATVLEAHTAKHVKGQPQWHPDMPLVAFIVEDGKSLIIWDAERREIHHALKIRGQAGLTQAIWNAKGDYLIAGSSAGLHLWNAPFTGSSSTLVISGKGSTVPWAWLEENEWVLFEQGTVFAAFSMKSGQVIWRHHLNQIQQANPFPTPQNIWVRCNETLVRLDDKTGTIKEYWGFDGFTDNLKNIRKLPYEPNLTDPAKTAICL